MISNKKLKSLREQFGWSQEHLAAISGISARTIQRIEATGNCSLESKMALAAALEVHPKELSPSEVEHAGLISPTRTRKQKMLVLIGSLLLLVLYQLATGLESWQVLIHLPAALVFPFWVLVIVTLHGIHSASNLFKLLLGVPVTLDHRTFSAAMKDQTKWIGVCSLITYLLIAIPPLAKVQSWNKLVGAELSAIIFCSLYALILYGLLTLAKSKLDILHIDAMTHEN